MTTVLHQDQYQRKDIPVIPNDLLLEKNAPEWEQGIQSSSNFKKQSFKTAIASKCHKRQSHIL